MRSFRSESFLVAMAMCFGFACVSALAQTPQAQPQRQKQAPARPKAATPPKPHAPVITGVGSSPTQDDMGNLAWTAGPSGNALPQGSGTAKDGAEIFQAKCAMCHGED